MSDMVVVVSAVGHGLFADRAVRAVVIYTDKLLRIAGKLVRAEADNLIPVNSEGRDQRIIRIEYKCSFVINAVRKGVKSPEIELTLPRARYTMISRIADIPLLMPSMGDSTVASL